MSQQQQQQQQQQPRAAQEEEAEGQASLQLPDLEELRKALLANVEIKNRSYHLKTYKRCFIGSEAVTYMVKAGLAASREQAVLLGNLLLQSGAFFHVARDHSFKDERLFYRFAEHFENSGAKPVKGDGSAVSWGDFLPKTAWSTRPSLSLSSASSSDSSSPSTTKKRGILGRSSSMVSVAGQNASSTNVAYKVSAVDVSPLDEHNVKLLDNVHPAKWIDPDPSGKVYNVVVIGAGAGGLVTASGCSGVGAKVAIIEKHMMGGDCLNVGCVPSKALLKCAKVAHTLRTSSRFGVHVKGEVEVDFGQIMERMRRLRAKISPIDSFERYSTVKGVDVFKGHGMFTGKHTVEVNGQKLRFAKAVIATGGSPGVPNVPGLRDVPFLTNLNVFNLTKLPKRLAVIGAGPIGCELAQAFQRFGSEVVVFVRSDRILRKEDPAAADVVFQAMKDDGVRFVTGAQLKRVHLSKKRDSDDDDDSGDGDNDDVVDQKEEATRLMTTGFEIFGKDTQSQQRPVRIVYSVKGEEEAQEHSEVFDSILVATGRVPNVEGMGLEAAGVEYDKRSGVLVNDMLQTTQKHIFAVGDVVAKYQFTHVADFMARMVIRNALFFGSDRFSDLLIPWATYTDPEVAHVGLYESDLKEKGVEYDTYERPFADIDRALLDGDTLGFCRIHTKKGGDQILGCTIVGAHAGDMISEVTLAMQSNTGLGRVATVIHPYPTQAEAVRQCGDAFNRTRLTPTIKSLFRTLMKYNK